MNEQEMPFIEKEEQVQPAVQAVQPTEQPVPVRPVMEYSYTVVTAPEVSTAEVCDPRAERKAAMRSIRKDSNYLSFAACGMFLAMNVVTLIFLVLAMVMAPSEDLAYGGTTPTMFFLVNAVAAAVGTPLSFFIFAVAKKMDFSDYLRFEKVQAGRAVLYIGLSILVCMLANFPANWISELITEAGLNDVTQTEGYPDSFGSAVACFFAIAVLPPIVEEFAFRGIVLSHLRRHGDLLAVLGSALIFAFAHGNVVQTPFAFFAGLMLGIAYIKTNNLLVPIIIHFLNNSLSVMMEIFYGFCSESVANGLSNLLFLLYLLAGVVCAIVVLVQVIRGSDILTLTKPETKLSPVQRFWALVSNPGFLVMLGYTIVSCVMMMYM